LLTGQKSVVLVSATSREMITMPQLPSGLSTRPETFAPTGESSLRLQRAIESLNLNLDDELRRYRQSQSGQSPAPVTPARLQLRQQRKPLDLIAVKVAANAADEPATAPGVASPPTPRLQEILGQASVPNSQAYPPTTAVNQVRLSHGGTLTTYRAAPEEYYESSEALLGSLPNGEQATRSRRRREEPEYAASPLRQLFTPLGMGALLLLLVGSAGFGYLVTSPETAQYITDNPITRQLKGEPTDAETGVALGEANGESEAGFQPMGPDLSEKEFMSLDLSSISTLPSEESDPGVQTTSIELQPEAGGRPGQPNPAGSPAAADATRSALLRAEIVSAPGRSTASAAPSASTRPASTPAQRSTSPSAPATASASTTPAAVVPAPIVRPPQPLARSSAPAPVTQAPPARVAPPAPITQVPQQAAAPNYYVVTNYNGAQSLEAARGVVGDAYVRNFSNGTRIQMGAFSQASSAQNLVNQLQQQGIPAQVVTP
jgi:hypothetical protein